MKLLETIKCKDGRLCNLEFHQARFNAAMQKYFPLDEVVSLQKVILVPEKCNTGLFRCRVVYSNKIDKVEFIPHQYRKIRSLKLVEDNTIDYSYKYSEREHLNRLFALRENCDDILIVKNGCISDSFTANPIFFDGAQWWTSNTPLLPGTQRAKLLSEGKIMESRITPNCLSNYKKVGLINALWDMDDMPIIEVKKNLK